MAENLRKPLLRKGHLLNRGLDMHSYTNLLDDDNATGPNGNDEDNDVALIITLVLVTIISSSSRISLRTSSHVVHTSAKHHVRGLLPFFV